MPSRHGNSRQQLLTTGEFGRRHGVSKSRIRQLIMEDRIWPKPRKVGGAWVIGENAIILDPPERQGFQKFVARLQQGTYTQKDLQDFINEAQYWIERGIR